MERFKRDLETLKQVKEKLQEDWGHSSQRELGQVYFDPPLNYDVGVAGFKED